MSIYDPKKELRLLLAFFGDAKVPHCEPVRPEEIPEPYRRLLVHHDHMTVTLETHHNDKVRVVPYQVHRQGDLYARKLDLITETGGKIVMTGLMLFNFTFCSDEVRDLIIEQKTPLGRILIEHNIMRRVSAGSYMRFETDDEFVARFHLDQPRPAYGRLATIYCDEQPAVDLLEIVTPDS